MIAREVPLGTGDERGRSGWAIAVLVVITDQKLTHTTACSTRACVSCPMSSPGAMLMTASCDLSPINSTRR